MGKNRPSREGYTRKAGPPPPNSAKHDFWKKGGVKTTKVNDCKRGDRRVLKENHRKPNHQWCSTEYFREQRIRASE